MKKILIGLGSVVIVFVPVVSIVSCGSSEKTSKKLSETDLNNLKASAENTDKGITDKMSVKNYIINFSKLIMPSDTHESTTSFDKFEATLGDINKWKNPKDIYHIVVVGRYEKIINVYLIKKNQNDIIKKWTKESIELLKKQFASEIKKVKTIKNK